MKVLVCGDRRWTNVDLVDSRLSSLPPDTVIIEGDARGADGMAGEAACRLALDLWVFPANWDRHGRAAGPIRNRVMLDQKPDLVIAFHNNLESSKGTKDCVNEARKRGIKVEVISSDGDVRC